MGGKQEGRWRDGHGGERRPAIGFSSGDWHLEAADRHNNMSLSITMREENHVRSYPAAVFGMAQESSLVDQMPRECFYGDGRSSTSTPAGKLHASSF
jgi:hypothetical protein